MDDVVGRYWPLFDEAYQVSPSFYGAELIEHGQHPYGRQQWLGVTTVTFTASTVTWTTTTRSITPVCNLAGFFTPC